MTYIVGGTDAGKQLVPYYMVAEGRYPILPDDVIIDGDTAAGTFGLAWYRGLDFETGFPIYAVRDDIVIAQTPYIGFHEAGHAFQTIIARHFAELYQLTFMEAFNFVRERYWSMRRFPGTWYDAQLGAINGGGWMYYPDESFADAFAHVILRSAVPVHEWTWNWNGQYALRPADAEAFFDDLQSEAFGGLNMDEARVRAIIDERLATFAAIQRETGHAPIRDAFNDHKHKYIKDTSAGTLEVLTSDPVVTLGNE